MKATTETNVEWDGDCWVVDVYIDGKYIYCIACQTKSEAELVASDVLFHS